MLVLGVGRLDGDDLLDSFTVWAGSLDDLLLGRELSLLLLLLSSHKFNLLFPPLLISSSHLLKRFLIMRFQLFPLCRTFLTKFTKNDILIRPTILQFLSTRMNKKSVRSHLAPRFAIIRTAG